MDGWSGENAKYARVRDGNLNKSFLNFVKVIFDWKRKEGYPNISWTRRQVNVTRCSCRRREGAK